MDNLCVNIYGQLAVSYTINGEDFAPLDIGIYGFMEFWDALLNYTAVTFARAVAGLAFFPSGEWQLSSWLGNLAAGWGT